MEKAHTRINWENYPSKNTKLNAINLNKMDSALDEVDNRVISLNTSIVSLDTTKANQETVDNTVSDWTFDKSTGIATVTKVNGDTTEYDTMTVDVLTNQLGEMTLEKSKSGGLKINRVDGESQQNGEPTPDAPIEIKSVEISEIKTSDGNGNESVAVLSKPIVLNGIGDSKDVIENQNGTFTTQKNIATTTLTYIHSVLDISGDCILCANTSFTAKKAGKLNALCDRFKMDDALDYSYEHAYFDETESNKKTFYMFISKSRLSPTEETESAYLTAVRSWIRANNVKVLYERETTYSASLPEVDQFSLRSLLTFDNVTYISTDSVIEPKIEVEYGTTKVGAYLLNEINESKISNIKVSNVIKQANNNSLNVTNLETVNVVTNNEYTDNWSELTSYDNISSIGSMWFFNGKFILTHASLTAGLTYSNDGKKWVKSNLSGIEMYIRGLSYGDSKYVAVGDYGKIAYSYDFENWQETESGISSNINDIVYANNMFVAVGRNGVVLISKDGITWEQNIVGDGTSNIYRISYGNKRFVIFDSSKYDILYSENAIDWTYCGITDMFTTANNKFISTIKYGGGKFYAPSPSYGVFYSEDGVSWNVSTDVNNPYYTQDMTYANGTYIIIGYNGHIAYSSDCIHWFKSKFNNTSAVFTSVEYGNGKLIASAATGQMTILEFEKETKYIDDVINELYSRNLTLPNALVTIQADSWTTSAEYDGYGYVFEHVIEKYYDEYPEWFLKPLSGIVPTEAEQTAFENIAAMKLDISDTSSPKLKFYAATQPTTDILVLVKGVQ